MSVNRITVSFQGEAGAYSEEAIHQHWPNSVRSVASRTFSDVIASVTSGRAQYGILPVDNSIVGPIVESQTSLYEAMAKDESIKLVDECSLAVKHSLVALPGASLANITTVASHPAALAQCEKFFRSNPQLTPMKWYDTAAAAQMVSTRYDHTMAAIASSRAAELYKLQILEKEIQDMSQNYTRFVIITRTGADRW